MLNEHVTNGERGYYLQIVSIACQTKCDIDHFIEEANELQCLCTHST